MMMMLIQASPLQEYEHLTLNTSRGTAYELVGSKPITFERMRRRLKIAWHVMHRVREEQPDIIHFQCGTGRLDFVGDALVMRAAKISDARMILHWHRDPRNEAFPGQSRFTKAFFRYIVSLTDAVFVLSDCYRDALVDVVPADKVFVIPNTCEESLLTMPRSVNQCRKRKIKVIFIGRLSKEKGIYDLLDAAARIILRAPNIYFDLAGVPSPPSEARKINKLITARGLADKIILHGMIQGQEKARFFQQGDILVLPSYRESFGIAVLEGMAAGMPIVANRIGVLPDIVEDNVTGYLVMPGDIAALADAILSLYYSPKKRYSMGLAGREKVLRDYSPNVIGGKVRDIYSQLISG